MKMKHHKTKNGMGLITVFRPETDSCLLSVYVRGGSRSESEDKNGINHLIEHLILKESKNFDNITNIFKDLNVHSEGHVGRETCDFRFQFPVDTAEKTIKVISDIFVNPSFNEKNISFEKSVLREELLGFKEDMSKQFYNTCLEHLFPDNSFSLPPEGQMERIVELNRKDLGFFFKKRYSQKNICLVLIVPEGTDDLTKEVLKEFEGIIQGEEKNEFLCPEQIRGEKTEEIPLSGSDLSHISLFFNAYSIADDRYRIAKFFSMLLDRKLHDEMREKKALVYDMDTYHNFYSDFGFIEVSTRCEKSKREEVIKELKTIIKTIGFEGSEVDSLKSIIEKRVGKDRGDSYVLSDYYGFQYLFQGSAASRYEDDISFVQKICLEDIEGVRQDLLNLDASALFFT